MGGYPYPPSLLHVYTTHSGQFTTEKALLNFMVHGMVAKLLSNEVKKNESKDWDGVQLYTNNYLLSPA